MCGGGKSKSPAPPPKVTAVPNPNAVADTSNDYNSRRNVIAATGEPQPQSTTFGSELGG